VCNTIRTGKGERGGEGGAGLERKKDREKEGRGQKSILLLNKIQCYKLTERAVLYKHSYRTILLNTSLVHVTDKCSPMLSSGSSMDSFSYPNTSHNILLTTLQNFIL